MPIINISTIGSVWEYYNGREGVCVCMRARVSICVSVGTVQIATLHGLQIIYCYHDAKYIVLLMTEKLITDYHNSPAIHTTHYLSTFTVYLHLFTTFNQQSHFYQY